jgi:hypothetical protein
MTTTVLVKLMRQLKRDHDIDVVYGLRRTVGDRIHFSNRCGHAKDKLGYYGVVAITALDVETFETLNKLCSFCCSHGSGAQNISHLWLTDPTQSHINQQVIEQELTLSPTLPEEISNNVTKLTQQLQFPLSYEALEQQLKQAHEQIDKLKKENQFLFYIRSTAIAKSKPLLEWKPFI